MARYSTFQYGTQTYGGGRGVTRSTLLAQVTSYTTITVTITTPLRVGDRYMLVRTYNGAAEHPTAGLTVSDSVIVNTEFTLTDGVTNYADSDLNNDIALSPGWVYYTLFVFDASGGWIREAATSVVLPADRGTLDYLIKALPSVYTAPDANPITPPTLDSDLARFLSGITLTYDELASSVDNVLPDVRSRATIRRLHDAYATGIGMPSEYTIGVASTARLYRESGFIYRNKGTARGIETYVEALTGWQTTVTESPNLFLNRDDSSFESGVGDWETTGGTLTRVVVNEPSVTSATELYPYDTTVLPWAQEAVGQFALTASSGTMTLPYVKAGSLPVTGGAAYRFEVPVKATSGTPTVTLYIDWYSQSGSLISTSTSPTKTSTSAWTPNFFLATAPDTATSAALRITVAGSIGNTVHLDMLSFTDTDDYIDDRFVYRDPRSVTIICDPTRMNLVKDPSFENDLVDWSARAGSVSIDSATSYLGLTSAQATGSRFEVISNTTPVDAGYSYSLSLAYLLSTGQASAAIEWLDADRQWIGTSSSSLIQALYGPALLEPSTDYAYNGSRSIKSTIQPVTYWTDPIPGYAEDPYFGAETDTPSSVIVALDQSLPSAGTYTVSAFFYIPLGSALAGRTVTLFDESGQGGVTVVSQTPATLTVGEWVRAVSTFTYDGTATLNRAFAARYDGGTAIGDVFYTDGWMVESGSTASTFSEASSLGTGWVGSDTNVSTLSDPWGTKVFSAVAPDDAVYARVVLSGMGTTNFDAVCLEQGSNLPVFFSGAVGDASGADTSWVGTPAESYSVLYPQRLVKLARLIETLDYYVPHGVSWRVLLWDSEDPEATRLVTRQYRIRPAVLDEAVWYIDAAYASDAQVIPNLGWGGSALNAQAGSSGSADSNDPKHLPWTGENYVYLPGVAGNYLSVPDEAALDITGDIDIRVRVALDDWTPATYMALAGKWVIGSNDSYYLRVTPSGTLEFIWTSDGLDANKKVRTSTAAVAASDGGVKWVRSVLDVDNGAAGHDVKFYTSDDGVSWTQLGTTVTTAGTTSIYAGTRPLEIGAVVNVLHTTGSFYRAIVKNGIDGPTVLDVDCSQITSGSATSFTARTGQTVTINRSTSGRKAVAVTQPCWSFGSDDYMQVADDPALEFNTGESGTILAVIRPWLTPTTNGRIVWKGASSGTHYGFSLSSTAFGGEVFDSATNIAARTAPSVMGRTNVAALVLDRVNDTAYMSVDAVSGAATALNTLTDIGVNANTLTIGRQNGTAYYSDFEGIAFAVFRKALTQYEIELLNDYFQARD